MPDKSNQDRSWLCDHSQVDVVLVNSDGELLGRPWLTIAIDIASGCVMGFHLGYEAPNPQAVALALRHAILPKQYSGEYELQHQWQTYGLPQHFYTARDISVQSDRLEQIARQLGFTHHFLSRSFEIHSVERLFGSLNTKLFSALPGYTQGSSRSQNTNPEASLTLPELEKLVVRYFVDLHNQQIMKRGGDLTKFEVWKAGLTNMPQVFSEQELDACFASIVEKSSSQF
jgi:putative transposase